MQERVKGNEKERRMGRRGGGRVFEGCKISANTVFNFSKGREREGDKREKREGVGIGEKMKRGVEGRKGALLHSVSIPAHSNMNSCPHVYVLLFICV